jgi:ribosomal protein S14
MAKTKKKQKLHFCPRCRERKPRDAFPTDHTQRCKACGGRNGPWVRIVLGGAPGLGKRR